MLSVIKQFVFFVHRWLGVALCLVALLWFLSGIGMMYWSFPTVDAADRLERAAALDRSKIALSPLEAFARLQAEDLPTQVRLNTLDSRPVYRFRFGRAESVIYADTGETPDEVSPAMMARVASAWTGQAEGASRAEPVTDIDQWTVQGIFQNRGPLWKYSWPNGEEVYVSEGSGEVVQYTTRATRLGAYLGPIPHWLYFTPLRKHPVEWTNVVVWSSGITAVTLLLGIVAGFWMYSPSKRYRRNGTPTSIPYRGQKRWHMLLGLVFGVAGTTWAFSGLLSMDPFPIGSSGVMSEAAMNIPTSLRRAPDLLEFRSKDPRAALAELADLEVKELEPMIAGGEPVYLATLSGGETRIVPLQGPPRLQFEESQIVNAVTSAAQPEGLAGTRMLHQYDRYYLDRRRERPLPVIVTRVNDAAQTRFYIDPKTARIVGGYRSQDWATRWLYHALHSFDFPWLYNHRPAWDIVVIMFMLGGAALCVTSIVLAWRVLGRTLRSQVGGGFPLDRADTTDDLSAAQPRG